MKVTILGPLDLEYMGGGETNSMMIGNILAQEGADVHYYGAGCPSKNIPIEKIYPQINFHYIPSAFKRDPMAGPGVLKMSSLLSLGLIGMFGYSRVMDMVSDSDVIYFSYPSVLARRLIPYAMKNGKKVILANHGTFFEYFGNSSNPILRAFRQLGLDVLIKPVGKFSRNLKIHTQTSFQSGVYRKLGFSEDSIMEIPQNNVNFKSYKVGKPKGQFTVTFLGRIVKSKGIDLLSEVIKMNPGIRFRVIGNGPLLEKLMKDTSGYPVEIYGYLSEGEKLRILEDSDLMVVPSIFDSLSIATIEGLASGLPIVSSTISQGPKYILERDSMFGKLVGRNPDAFTEAIKIFESYRNNDHISYYSDKLARRKRAEKIFDVDSINRQLKAGFREYLKYHHHDNLLEKIPEASIQNERRL